MSKGRNQLFRCRFGLLLCSAVALILQADKPVPAPDVKMIRGAWFGFDEDKLRFCRVELYPDGKGLCASLFVDNPPELYVIKKWSLDEFSMQVDLEPLEKDTEAIYMKGIATLHELHLEIGGVGDKQWKRKARLVKEEEFEAKNARAKERIEKYKAEQTRKAKE